MKSSSRSSPGRRSVVSNATSASSVSPSSGRAKNSDRLCACASGRRGTPCTSRSASTRLVSRCGARWCVCVAAGSPTRSTNCSSSATSASSLPWAAPKKLVTGIRVGSAGVDTTRLAAIVSGASGAHACQAASTAGRCSGSQVKWNEVIVGAGTDAKTSEVTTPIVPLPPPRSAQNSSGSNSSSQSTIRPSPSTTRAARSASQVSPCARPSTPSPPPSVRPAMPTAGPQPAGIVTPAGASAS